MKTVRVAESFMFASRPALLLGAINSCLEQFLAAQGDSRPLLANSILMLVLYPLATHVFAYR